MRWIKAQSWDGNIRLAVRRPKRYYQMIERKDNMLLVTFLICIFTVSLLLAHKSPAEVPAKFTERARIIINYANEEAIRLNHDKIDTEHLLLGLVHEGQGIAARALEELGVSLERLETSIKSMIKEKRGKAKLPTQSLAFTRAASKVLQYDPSRLTW